ARRSSCSSSPSSSCRWDCAVLVRPVAARHIGHRGPAQIDGTKVYIGRTGIVTEAVDENQGRIKIGGSRGRSAVAQSFLGGELPLSVTWPGSG
ncbi:MAG: NfeD family protein, partial [Candidatus Limnocylindrales bacterium]